LSVCSQAGDAEEWQEAGGVAGVVAQRGGDVAVPVAPQGGDGQGLRRLAMACGVVPARSWRGCP
jgi:hypothetical protein